MEFELYFIKPLEISSTWRTTSQMIAPEHIMSFTMTKNVFTDKLTNGGVASSTASITVDNSSGVYTSFFSNREYWLYVAKPQEEASGQNEFIVSLHLDNVKTNKMHMVTADCFDALDLLNLYTIPSATIKSVVETPNAVFADLYNALDFEGAGFTFDLSYDEVEIGINSWTLTEDITYRQLLYWIAERFGGMYQPSGAWVENKGERIEFRTITTNNTAYPKLPNSIDYAMYYDNASDPNRPISFDRQTRDLTTFEVTGLRVYDYDTKEPRMITGNDSGYVVEIKDNPFITSEVVWAIMSSSWVGITTFRHTTDASKEAFCDGGYYTDTTATPISLSKRYHAVTMGFINYNPHTITVGDQQRQVYGDLTISPISTYNYVCNGTENITFNAVSEVENELIVPMTPTEMAIDELQSHAQIIETGEDNGWTYQKYSDGTYESQYRVTLTSQACTTAWGNVYRTADIAVGVPSFENSTSRNIQATFWRRGTTGVFGWAVNSARPYGGNTGSWIVVSPQSGNVSGTIDINVRGQY